MSNILNILMNDFSKIVLSTITYILFRIINRFKYKKKIDLKKEIIILLSIVYLLSLFNIVTYPINEYRVNNYQIFHEIKRYKIGSKLFIKNILGNIIIFIPFGMIIKVYFNCKLLSLIFITIFYSFIIEITQFMIGRVFDIDDILLNLFGSIIGYLFSNYSSMK